MFREKLVSTITYVPSKVYAGYTLFTPNGGTTVWLIDMLGRIVHSWEIGFRPAAHGILLENGHLLYQAQSPHPDRIPIGGGGGSLKEYDWNGAELWSYDDPNLHHDFCLLSNGNRMVLRWEAIPEHLASRVEGGVPGTELDGIMYGDGFREIDEEGNIVWEYHLWEHLDPVKDAFCPLCHREEWTHCNSCTELPDGKIMTTALSINSILVIDKKTGDISWRWGQGELAHPHNPTLLDDGNILVFDNGLHRPCSYPSYSRVLEMDPSTGKIVWEYKDKDPSSFFASFISGCQRLPNGNTLICDGPSGYFFEVTENGEVVWEYVVPFRHNVPKFNPGYSNFTFRAHRYSPNYAGLTDKEFDPERFKWMNRAFSSEAFRL